MTRGATILLVDDEPAVLEGFRRALRAEPWEILCATSVDEALRTLEAREVDVVVSDQEMPGGSGTTLLAAVRERAPDIGRLMLTGKATVATAQEAINACGVAQFLVKPLPAGALAEAIRGALRERAIAVDLQRAGLAGDVTAGVLHDINNLLTVIAGQNRLISSEPNGSTVPRADVIQTTVTHAGALSQHLMRFLRTGDMPREEVDLSAVLGRLATLVAKVVPADVKVTWTLADDVAPLAVNAVQLEQVVLNLLINARDAMPDGGQVTVRTSMTGAAGTGRHVTLEVTDTGTGMTDEVRRRLFEPFFTTKAGRGGTGLGLATVRAIVRQHRGHIDVESELGRGSTFRVHLPTDVAPIDRAARNGPCRSQRQPHRDEPEERVS